MNPESLCELIRKEFTDATIEHILANFKPEWFEALKTMAAGTEGKEEMGGSSDDVCVDMGGGRQVSVFQTVCYSKHACDYYMPQEVFFKRVPHAEQNSVPLDNDTEFTYGIYARDEYAVCGIGFHNYPKASAEISSDDVSCSPPKREKISDDTASGDSDDSESVEEE